VRPSANHRFHKVAPEPKQLPTPNVDTSAPLYQYTFIAPVLTSFVILAHALYSTLRSGRPCVEEVSLGQLVPNVGESWPTSGDYNGVGSLLSTSRSISEGNIIMNNKQSIENSLCLWDAVVAISTACFNIEALYFYMICTTNIDYFPEQL
jgi:hypothetical protein